MEMYKKGFLDLAIVYAMNKYMCVCVLGYCICLSFCSRFNVCGYWNDALRNAVVQLDTELTMRSTLAMRA